METPSPTSVPESNRAPNACNRCKAKKRKCDKRLPACVLCARRRVQCDYGLAPETPQWPLNSVGENGSALGCKAFAALDYPTVCFLDPSLVQHGHLDLPQAIPRVKSELLDLLGTMDDIVSTVTRHVEHARNWLPFLSRARLETLLTTTSHPADFQTDFVLLLLAVKLLTSTPSNTAPRARSALYLAVKHFHLEMEGSTACSLFVLQAGVLISLYEIAHGIYPAAFLSVASCAHYANAIGIGVPRCVPAKKATTVVDMEERRRVWWAIVVLERFVHIGCPGRPLAIANPKMHDILPSDDVQWDQGIVKTSKYSTIGTPMTAQMTKFALICQASRLLGHVLDLNSRESGDEDPSWQQLDRTLQSILAASLHIDEPDFDQITFIYSTLAALHTPHVQGDGERARRAREFVGQLVDRIEANLVESQCLACRDPEDMPPWGLFFAYKICVALSESARNEKMERVVHMLRTQLRKVGERWCAAGVYLQLLEAREVIARC